MGLDERMTTVAAENRPLRRRLEAALARNAVLPERVQEITMRGRARYARGDGRDRLLRHLYHTAAVVRAGRGRLVERFERGGLTSREAHLQRPRQSWYELDFL